MRALILGASGAVGAAAAGALRDRGHTVIGAGRRAPAGGIALDATTTAGLELLADRAATVDIVLDASGLELPGIMTAVATTPLVDVSATAHHLERLSATVPANGTVLLGAGIAPGLSTVLIDALSPEPGDDVDIAVVLGAGEQHGPAAVDWTVRLAGSMLHASPEPDPIPNLRSRRRLPMVAGPDRVHLRADFPDDLLIGAPRGVAVRSWLAMDSRVATAALGLVGAVPALALLLRYAPHLGGETWSVSAIERGSGRMIAATGEGQSGATGRLAALAAERLVERGLRGAVTMADAVTVDELRLAGGVRLVERSLAVRR